MVVHRAICAVSGLFAPAMPGVCLCQNQSMLQVHVIVLSLLILFYVQCFHLVLFGPFIGAQLIELKGYSGLFGGTIAIIIFTLILQVFYKNCFHLVLFGPFMVRNLLS